MTWAVGGGTQVRLSTALSAVAPSATAALIGFVCPQQHRLRRAEVARVGFLVPPHHYCGQDVLAISIAHQQGAAQALFAGFCPHNLSPDLAAPSWESNVAGSVAVCCYATELISDFGAVYRDDSLPRRTHIPKGASVGLRDNSFECLTHAVFQGLGLR